LLPERNGIDPVSHAKIARRVWIAIQCEREKTKRKSTVQIVMESISDQRGMASEEVQELLSIQNDGKENRGFLYIFINSHIV